MRIVFVIFFFIFFSTLSLSQVTNNSFNSGRLSKKDTIKENILDTVDITRKYKTIIVDSLKRKHFSTAYDLLKNDSNFRFEDDGVYYQGKLLTTIKVNGQVFNFTSPIELLKMFPSSILSSFRLDPYTDPLNKFWGNENIVINSIDLRTPNGKISGVLGNMGMKYNFRRKYDFIGNTIYFKNNTTTLFDLNLNNNSWDWGADVGENLNKVVNSKISVQNTTKFKNGDLSIKAGYTHNNILSKDYYIDSLAVLQASINDGGIERVQKSFNRSFNVNSTLNRVFDKLYFDVTLGAQKDAFKNRNSNLNNTTNDFLSNDSSEVEGYNGGINVGYKLYKNNLFLITSVSFGQNKSVNGNNYQNDSIFNSLSSSNKSDYIQTKMSLKFNFSKVFLGDLYYNLNRSNALSVNQINSAESVEVKLKNQIQNIGTTFRWSKSNFDFHTNIYYERSNNRFENDLEDKSTMRNKGLLYNSSLIIRGLKSRLNNTFTFGKVIIYPTLFQKNPTNVILSDNYSSIGNPDLKNQSVFNFNWSSNYQLKNADNLNLSFSTSLNKDKIIENLSLLNNDTIISGVSFIKGIRLLSYANSRNTNSPNSNLVLTYVKNNLFISNLSLQNGLSYSTSATDRYINNENFMDKSATYAANINTFYYSNTFSANVLYNISLNNNRFTSAEESQMSSVFRTLSHSISTTGKLNYFALFNFEISNLYNVTNSSGISFENSRTDMTLSQKYLKGRLEASLNVFDLFNQMKQSKNLKNDFLLRRESRTNLIGRYFLLNIIYKFQNLKS
ncbi:outer membrane beta-barrel family protein [Sphingobacterium sp. GVS05A]|uniref:outer membrane beta-barrel family protein n=1 Tax=Sphingobacterium sp. GVS05A TaxID=2862679 RepID=UPI001CC02132|nr:outer membrane beta-barrel family protein [Sphingobacterium sp. GVS05A]